MARNTVVMLVFLGAALAQGRGAVAADLFADTFIPKFKEACVGSAKYESEGKIADDKVTAYCNCAAKRMSDGFTDGDKTELMQTTTPPSPPLQQKMNDLVAQCASESLR
jgi:hypothetical protein